MVTLLALAVGIALGVLINKQLDPNRRKNSELEKKLAESEQRFADYQAEVTEHFTETSQRVHALTRNYKEVHDYLATSAIKLASPTISKQLFSATQITLPAHRQDSEPGDNDVIDHEADLAELKSRIDEDPVDDIATNTDSASHSDNSAPAENDAELNINDGDTKTRKNW